MALIVGSAIFAYALPGLLEDPDTSTGMNIVLYDANGEAVWEGGSQGAIELGITNTQGVEVVKAVVTITYTISSEDGTNLLSPSASGNLYITECFGSQDVQAAEIDKSVVLDEKTVASGTYTYTLDLTDFLPSQGGFSSIEYGWKVMFEAEIDAQASIDGSVVSASWTSNPVIFQLYWSETTSPGSITIDGDVSVGFS